MIFLTIYFDVTLSNYYQDAAVKKKNMDDKHNGPGCHPQNIIWTEATGP
jgi:hypothetical protein